MTCFPGWTWEYVEDNMTLPRLKTMNAYWKQNPPLHQLVKNFMGYKPPVEQAPLVEPPEFEE